MQSDELTLEKIEKLSSKRDKAISRWNEATLTPKGEIIFDYETGEFVEPARNKELYWNLYLEAQKELEEAVDKWIARPQREA